MDLASRGHRPRKAFSPSTGRASPARSAAAARLERAHGEGADRPASDHLVARLAVSGATSMAWNIRRDADLLRTEAEARAEAIGNVWIEKIDIDCRRPVVGSAESA